MVRPPPIRAVACGFTLIELIIALAIVAMLAGAAWPHYADTVRRSRRVDAMDAALKVQQAQERWLGNQRRYTGSMTDLGLATASPAQYYSLALSNASATGYTLTVNAASDRPQRNDTGCTAMTVTVVRGHATYAPATCWSR